jgi:signal transduction histidine kinase
MARLPILIALILLCANLVQLVNGQREILPLPLDKLNRDSLNKVIRQKEKEKDYQALGNIYGGMLAFYFVSEYQDSAIIYGTKAENYLYKAGDSAKYYYIQLQLGDLSRLAFDVAESYYKKALAYYTKTENYKMMAHALNDLAYRYYQKNDAPNYLKYYTLAVEANKKGKDTLLAVILNESKVRCQIGYTNLNEAIKLLLTNIKLLNTAKYLGNGEHERIFWKGLELNRLAEYYYAQKNYSLAIKYLKEANKYNQYENIGLDRNFQIYRSLMLCYINIGIRDSALKYTDSFAEQANKVMYNFDPKKLTELSLKYETEKRRRQIEQLEQDNKIQKLTVDNQERRSKALVIIFFLAVISLYFIIKSLLQKRKIALELAKQEALYKEQLHKQKELEIRTRISKDLHDDVGATLSSVKAYSEILKENPENSVIAHLIKENAAEMIDRLEVITWAASPNHDHFLSLKSKINLYSAPICKAKNIHYRLHSKNIEEDITIPGEIRQNLYLIVKEAINNVSKYANAKNCTVLFFLSSDKFIVQIEDDGIGFDDNLKKDGNGLRNMQTRTDEMGGELTLTSNSNKGTTIRICLSYPFEVLKGKNNDLS